MSTSTASNNIREKEMNPFIATVLGSAAGGIATQVAGSALRRTRAIKDMLNDVNAPYPTENTKIFKEYLSRKGLKGTSIFTKNPSVASLAKLYVKALMPNLPADKVDNVAQSIASHPAFKRVPRFPHSNPALNYMWSGNSKNPVIGLHEAGHLVNWKFLKNIKHKIFAQSAVRAGLPAIGTLAGIILANQEKDSTANLAPIAAAAGYAPMLLDEAVASARAMKELSRIGGGYRKTWGQSKAMLPAFGTYLALAGGTVGGIYLIKKLLESRRRNRARNYR
jgi:hypothetical protein